MALPREAAGAETLRATHTSLRASIVEISPARITTAMSSPQSAVILPHDHTAIALCSTIVSPGPCQACLDAHDVGMPPGLHLCSVYFSGAAVSLPRRC